MNTHTNTNTTPVLTLQPFHALTDRLVPLCDGRPGLRAGLPVEVCEPAREGTGPLGRGAGEGETALEASRASGPSSLALPASPPILDFIASSEALDRYDEIICASGWRLEHYRQNPVFQNAHQYGDILFTLGKALITEVRTGQLSTLHSQPSTYLFQRIEFAVDANPMARIAYHLYKGKFLNAVSVGFIPLRWEDAEGTVHSSASRSCLPTLQPLPGPSQPARSAPLSLTPWLQPGEVAGDSASNCFNRFPLRLSALNPQPSTKFRRRYLEQELLEVSAVGIPANPEALQLGLKAGAIQKTDLRELLELLRALTSSPAIRGGDSLSPHAWCSNSHGDKLSPPLSLHIPPEKNRADSRRLLQMLSLARELRTILRRA